MRADRVSEKGRSPASRGRNKTCSWKLQSEAPGRKPVKKTSLNHRTATVSQQLSLRRHPCAKVEAVCAKQTSPSLLLQCESKNNAGCLRRCLASARTYASKFLVSRVQKYTCPRCFAKRFDRALLAYNLNWLLQGITGTETLASRKLT